MPCNAQHALPLAQHRCTQVAAYYFFWVMLPFSHSLVSPAGGAHVLFGTWLWVNTTWNLAMAVIADPGTVELATDANTSSNMKHVSAANASADVLGRRACGPPGSSYCRVCNVCIACPLARIMSSQWFPVALDDEPSHHCHTRILTTASRRTSRARHARAGYACACRMRHDAHMLRACACLVHVICATYARLYAHTLQIRVEQFDHHCPLTGGCIGANNFRFFFLFTTYCSAGLAYGAYLAWHPFRACIVSRWASCTTPVPFYSQAALRPHAWPPYLSDRPGQRFLGWRHRTPSQYLEFLPSQPVHASLSFHRLTTHKCFRASPASTVR